MKRTSILAAALASAVAAPALAAAPSGGGDNPGVGTVAPTPRTGQEVYQYICQSCHMADAKGGTGAGTIPALAMNPKLAGPAYPITMVLKGRGAMPWFNDTLTPAQIAQVVTYIRTSFGNNFPQPVTTEEVSKLAAAMGR